MKKERNELLEFLGGLAMLVVGLYLFTNKASVQTSFFAGNLSLFGLCLLYTSFCAGVRKSDEAVESGQV